MRTVDGYQLRPPGRGRVEMGEMVREMEERRRLKGKGMGEGKDREDRENIKQKDPGRKRWFWIQQQYQTSGGWS